MCIFIFPEKNCFPLVTGSPPYIPIGKGVISPHPQRAACRMELRGDITNYVQRAKQLLQPDGFFVVCFAANDPRPLQAFQQDNLWLHQKQDIIFRADRPPTISIYVVSPTPAKSVINTAITIRDKNGVWTDEYMQIRYNMGFVGNRR